MNAKYFIFSETDDSLSCSFCKKAFTDEVKLIPDCGESICGECYEALKENLTQAREFQCKACHERHSMPKNGLPNCKSLAKILKKRRIEKPLGDKAAQLRASIGACRERLRELEAFDKRDHVNCHCDQLEVEVMSAVESAIKHFNEIEKDLLNEINEYRQRCLDRISARSENKAEDSEDQAAKVDRELAKLSVEMDEFNSKWHGYFTQMETGATEQEIDTALKLAKQYEKKIDSLAKKLKQAALNGKISTIKIQQQYFQDKTLFEKLICFSSFDKSSVDMRIQETPSCTLEDHKYLVNQVIFLPNDRMVSCSRDYRVMIWDGDDGKELAEFSEWPASLALLPNGWLAIGLNDGEIRLWDIDAKREMRTLKGHTDTVVSLRLLKKGDLVSYSKDDTIKIWDPYSSGDYLHRTIKGHGNTHELDTLCGVLSNDILVACICDQDVNKQCLRSWSPSDGTEINSVPIVDGEVQSMLVLFDDQVALGFGNGTIMIIDLEDAVMSRAKEQAYRGKVTAFAQFNNLNLASAGHDNESYPAIIVIKLWNPEDLTLLQTIQTKHSQMINSLAISSDQKLIASASNDDTVKLWPILLDS